MAAHETRWLSDQIFTLPGLLSARECAELIAWAEGQGFDEAPVSTAGGPKMMRDVRNNTRVMCDDPARTAWLWGKLAPRLPRVRGVEPQAVGLNERLRVYRYDPGQRFSPHFDGYFARPNGERSHLTFLVFLNDGFEGGETVFPHGRVVPEAGTALCFVHQLLHEGAEVLAGRKYVLRSDVMYEAAR